MPIINYYWAFKASIPTITVAASGFAAFIADSPAFMDLMTRIVNGDISFYEIQQEINEIIVKAQQFADQVNDFVNKSNNASGSSGNSGNFDPNDWKDFIVRAGRNLKDHYIRHKQLLENITGKKYPKWKESNDAEAFLQDIQQVIQDGRVKYVGDGTLNKTSDLMHIFRGEEITIVTKLDGEFVTILTSGEGMDLKILIQ